MLLHLSCKDGGVKSGLKSHATKSWATFRFTCHCEAICEPIHDSIVGCARSIAIYHGITPLWEDPHFKWHARIVCLGHVKIVGWTIWHFV